MTPAENERLKECHCGKEPWVSKHANPKPTENIFGDMLPSKPWVSIQCRYGRHNNVLINVNANGDTIEEAECKAVKSWNEFQALISNKPTLPAHGGLDSVMKTAAEVIASSDKVSAAYDEIVKENAELVKVAEDAVKRYEELVAQCSQVRTSQPLKIPAHDFQAVLCDYVDAKTAKWLTDYIRERWPYPIEVTE